MNLICSIFLLIPLLLNNCFLNKCDMNEFIEILNSIYSKKQTEILKQVGIDQYAKSERHFTDSIRIEYTESLRIHKTLDSIWQQIDSCKICQEYWGERLGTYKNFDPMDFSSYDIVKILRYGYHNYLNGKPTKVDSLVQELKKGLRKGDSIHSFNATADTIEGVYIPKNYEEAITHIEKYISGERKQKFKNKNIHKAVGWEHMNLGLFLRNIWHIWGKSRLYLYFENLGYKHPDNISSIIMYGYHLELNGKPHSLEDAIAKHEESVRKFREKNKKE